MKKMYFSKVVCLLLVMIFTMSLVLTGCGTKSTSDTSGSSTVTATTQTQVTAEPKKELSPVTLNIAFPGDAQKGQNEVNDAISAKMKADGLGDFKFNYTFIPWDSYWQKLDLISASGEDYDLTWEHQTQIARAVSKQILAPLDSALEAYGKDIVANTPKYVFTESTFNGKIYAIPRVVPSSQYDWMISIRGDLREKYKIPKITDLSGLEKYMAAIKANEPSMIPAGFLIREVMFRTYTPSYYFPLISVSNNVVSSPVYIDLKDENLKVKSFLDSDNYKEMVDKMAQYYKLGYFPQPNQMPDYAAAFAAGKLAVSKGNVMFPTEKIDELTKAVPGAKMEEVFLNPSAPKYTNVASDNLLAVFSQSKKVNEAVAFMNWFRKSQENYDLWSYGIKDTNYKLDGNSVTVDTIAPEHSYQPISWAWTDLRFHRFSKNLDPEYLDYIKNWDKDAIPSPLLGFVLNTDPIKNEMAQMQTVMTQYSSAQQLGVVSYDSTKAKMMAGMKTAGLEKVIAEVQKQVDAFKAKK